MDYHPDRIGEYNQFLTQEYGSFEISGDKIPGEYNELRFGIGLPTERGPGIGISYTLDTEDIPEGLMEVFFSHPGFVFGELNQSNYITWQNVDMLEHYRHQGGLKTYTDEYHRKRVDLSNRPGRNAWLGKFTYRGAQKMWFGPGAYELIPRDKILSFRGGAVEIKALPNDIVFVHLYDRIYDGDLPHNQKVQQAFRDHLEVDRLANDHNSGLSIP